MSMSPVLKSLIVCPLCKSEVKFFEDEIWCKADGLAFPIIDGIPILIVEEARALSADERLSKS